MGSDADLLLKAQDGTISEFDGSLWGSMVEFITVGRDKEIIEISGAWMNYKQDTPYFLDQTIAVAKEVKIPVCLVGGVRGQKTIEKILNDTPIQYVSMARPFTAKPDLVMEWR